MNHANVPLIIMDALIKALESLGYSVKVGDRKHGTSAVIFDRGVRIKLKEKKKRVQHVLTPEEQARIKKGLGIYAPPYDDIFTGELMLLIDEDFVVRRTWADGKAKLESRLGSFIIGLVKSAKMLKDRDEEFRLEEIRRWEAELRRHEQEQRRKRELERFEALRKAAADWHEAQMIRGYLASMERGLEQRSDTPDKEKLQQWIEWAKGKADWLDSLVGREDPVLGIRRVQMNIEEPTDDD